MLVRREFANALLLYIGEPSFFLKPPKHLSGHMRSVFLFFEKINDPWLFWWEIQNWPWFWIRTATSHNKNTNVGPLCNPLPIKLYLIPLAIPHRIRLSRNLQNSKLGAEKLHPMKICELFCDIQYVLAREIIVKLWKWKNMLVSALQDHFPMFINMICLVSRIFLAYLT